MKKLLKPVFLLSLAAVFAFGLNLAITPDAEAGNTCPRCYIWENAPGWSIYGSCIDYSDPHCPIMYNLYRNNYSGQMCRGTIGQANI